MKISKKNIEFYADNILIKGIMHLPQSNNKAEYPPIVIGSHGLEGSKYSAKQTILSKLLPQNNIGFLRFDHRGCGDSAGEFLKDTTVANRASDFINAVKYILENRLNNEYQIDVITVEKEQGSDLRLVREALPLSPIQEIPQLV